MNSDNCFCVAIFHFIKLKIENSVCRKNHITCTDYSPVSLEWLKFTIDLWMEDSRKVENKWLAAAISAVPMKLLTYRCTAEFENVPHQAF